MESNLIHIFAVDLAVQIFHQENDIFHENVERTFSGRSRKLVALEKLAE